MGVERQYICDGCGDVVHGQLKGQFIHRDYIQIKGQIVLQQNDDQLRQRKYTYLTYGNKLSDDPSRTQVGEELSFCVKQGMPCFQKFLDRRRAEIEFHRQQKRQDTLREQRTEELKEEDRRRRIYGY